MALRDFYDWLFKNIIHRTIFISSLLAGVFLILSVIMNVFSPPSETKNEYLTPVFKGIIDASPILFGPDEKAIFRNEDLTVNLVVYPYIIHVLLMLGFYFFLLVAVATVRELQGNLSGWSEVFGSSLFTCLLTFLLWDYIPGQRFEKVEEYWKYFQTWHLYAVIIGIILLTLYIYFAEAEE